MTYRDDSAREAAKWSHDRLARAGQRAEDEQRQAWLTSTTRGLWRAEIPQNLERGRVIATSQYLRDAESVPTFCPHRSGI